MVSNLRLWKSNNNNMEEIEGLTKKHKNYSQVKVDAVCLNPKVEDKALVIEDLDIAEEDILIIELPKGKDIWVFAP